MVCVKFLALNKDRVVDSRWKSSQKEKCLPHVLVSESRSFLS